MLGSSTDGRSKWWVLGPGAVNASCPSLVSACSSLGPHVRVAECGGAAPEDRPKRKIKCASPANDALAHY